METRFQRKWNCFCPDRWQTHETTSDHALESYSIIRGCSNMLEDLSFPSLKLAHVKGNLLSLWSYVSRHRCKEGCCPSCLKICTCSMLTLCSSMSLQRFGFFFFSIYTRLLILLQLVCGQHNMEQKKALKNFDIKKQNKMH